jgi:large subunit ribosomal protein L22
MYALHRSCRLAPKKANLMARMVRGMPVPDAITLLSKTHKKSARMLEAVLKSAMANASHNLKQDPQSLIVKTIVVNQGQAYRRGVPMARGRVRPIKKFLCHIEVQLGLKEERKESNEAKESKDKKSMKKKKNTTSSKSSTSPSIKS